MSDADGRGPRPGARIDTAGPGKPVMIERVTVTRFSHQLRSLLTSIGAAADYLLNNEPDRGVRDEMLGIIAEQTGRIDGLLDDFLVIATSQPGEAADMSAVNLYHLTRGAVRELAGEAQSVGAWLVLDAAGVVPPVEGHQKPLKQAVTGTLRGLISLARPGERVVARLEDARSECGEKLVEFSVAIQSDDPRLAERAHDLMIHDTSVEAARRICEGHGGSLEMCENRPGVVCRLPAADVQIGPATAARAERRCSAGR